MATNVEAASPSAAAIQFLRDFWARFAGISLFLLVPCFWHRRIAAGDLASHVYNAWLTQLIEKGQAPGLYLVRRWNNVLVDLALLHLGNSFGLAAAEKIVVSLCVLIFFWGAFALVCAVTHRAPWFVVPCLAMLTYGWTFNVGFFNYYVSLGFGFFAIAILWRIVFAEKPEIEEFPRSRAGATPLNIFVATGLGVLVLVAHPQGFLWLLACAAYMLAWRVLRGWWKLTAPIAALAIIIAVRVYCGYHFEAFSIWDSFGPGLYLGSDQIALYSSRYLVLSLIALLFGVACFVFDGVRRHYARQSWAPLRLPFELYCIIVVATYVLPDVLRLPLYAGWIGSFALRLTTISAALGLCVLGFMQPRKWHTVGFGAIAAVFFAFLYRDTGVLNRMERQIESLVASLPAGERVTATIWAPPDSRLPYIVHMVDRACVGQCFSFQNYEPASGEFRVRANEDNPIVATDPDNTQSMEAGEYIVQPEDLPMAQIYQCDEHDLTRLCIRQLAAGEPNGRLGYHPPKD
jgi:hypothetical protein